MHRSRLLRGASRTSSCDRGRWWGVPPSSPPPHEELPARLPALMGVLPGRPDATSTRGAPLPAGRGAEGGGGGAFRLSQQSGRSE